MALLGASSTFTFTSSLCSVFLLTCFFATAITPAVFHIPWYSTLVILVVKGGAGGVLSLLSKPQTQARIVALGLLAVTLSWLPPPAVVLRPIMVFLLLPQGWKLFLFISPAAMGYNRA